MFKLCLKCFAVLDSRSRFLVMSNVSVILLYIICGNLFYLFPLHLSPYFLFNCGFVCNMYVT